MGYAVRQRYGDKNHLRNTKNGNLDFSSQINNTKLARLYWVTIKFSYFCDKPNYLFDL